jgi:hypothetical protein
MYSFPVPVSSLRTARPAPPPPMPAAPPREAAPIWARSGAWAATRDAKTRALGAKLLAQALRA